MKPGLVIFATVNTLCVALVIYVIGLQHQWWYLPGTPPECRGDYPKVVEFHQGMNLCAGQSAVVRP